MKNQPYCSMLFLLLQVLLVVQRDVYAINPDFQWEGLHPIVAVEEGTGGARRRVGGIKGGTHHQRRDRGVIDTNAKVLTQDESLAFTTMAHKSWSNKKSEKSRYKLNMKPTYRSSSAKKSYKSMVSKGGGGGGSYKSMVSKGGGGGGYYKSQKSMKGYSHDSWDSPSGGGRDRCGLGRKNVVLTSAYDSRDIEEVEPNDNMSGLGFAFTGTYNGHWTQTVLAVSENIRIGHDQLTFYENSPTSTTEEGHISISSDRVAGVLTTQFDSKLNLAVVTAGSGMLECAQGSPQVELEEGSNVVTIVWDLCVCESATMPEYDDEQEEIHESVEGDEHGHEDHYDSEEPMEKDVSSTKMSSKENR